jgi:hypothetical protein
MRIGHTRRMRGSVQPGFNSMLLRFPGSMLLASALAALPTLLLPTMAAADPEKVWPAGAYSFSDEQGGFRITGVSGTGTHDDPIVVTEELDSATPVTLTIRTIRPIKPFAESGDYANGIMYMRINALNNSGKAWVEFEFELQEILGQASVFGDGLSFDQRNKTPDNILSSNYADFDRNFEPYDRLLFRNGTVDPLKTVEFEFLVTDYTPRWTFYLVQDPRIPST